MTDAGGLIYGLGGQWQNWIRTSRAWPWSGARWRWTCPGSASPHAEEQISISSYADVVEAACHDLGLGAVAVVGTLWAGSSAPSWRSASRARGAADARVRRRHHHNGPLPGAGVRRRRAPPPCSSAYTAAATGRRAAADFAVPGAGAGGPVPEPARSGPGLRGDDEGRGQARLRRRPARLPRLRLPRAAARDRLPDAGRVGRERRGPARGRRRGVRAPDPRCAKDR